jgi:hypothetical protein
MNPSRVVPTLTEVLDEAVWRAESLSDLSLEAPFVPMPELVAPELPSADFDLDLGEVSPALLAPEPEPSAHRSSDAELRQRLSQALDDALDEILQKATRRLAESLLAELRQQLAPQLDLLLQQAIDELLRQDRRQSPGH